ncbi:tetratricopeptide repeat protein [Spirochaeta cellobiosiphila]|uniref:tetratricopeptide repeat protein n=1 Tax=Spirochaeta cellobiosiphila TaxID=504483 RepID=UPI000415B33B|nr:tetratricopeptide repeat protein [Spirochaeta cellobiosiphila]
MAQQDDALKRYLHILSEAYETNNNISIEQIKLLQEDLAETDLFYLNNQILDCLDKGDSYKQQGQWKAAKKEYEKAIKTDITNPDLYHRLAQLYWDNYRIKKDKSLLNRIKELNSHALYYEKNHYPTQKLKKDMRRTKVFTLLVILFLLLISSISGAIWYNSEHKKEKISNFVFSKDLKVNIPIYYDESTSPNTIEWEQVRSYREWVGNKWTYSGLGYFVNHNDLIDMIQGTIKGFSQSGITIFTQNFTLDGPLLAESKISYNPLIPEYLDLTQVSRLLISISQPDPSVINSYVKKEMSILSDKPRLDGVSLKGVSYWQAPEVNLDAYKLNLILSIKNEGRRNLTLLEGSLEWDINIPGYNQDYSLVSSTTPELKPGESVTFTIYREFPFNQFADQSNLPENITFRLKELQAK